MIAVTYTVALTGLDGTLVQIEAVASQGLPGIHIVGLGDKAIREAAQRVRTALKSSGFALPPRKYTVNLAPADLRKDGSHYDLAIAVSLLIASGQLPQQKADNALFFGELSLSGELRSTHGALLAADCAQHHTLSATYLPMASISEAQLIEGASLIPTPSLKALYLHLRGVTLLPAAQLPPQKPEALQQPPIDPFSPIIGQEHAKRALTIAMAGHHHLLLIGPPGVGKTLLAESAYALLPPLSRPQQITVGKLSLLAHEGHRDVTPPFRTPHHTVSPGRIIGDSRGRPGEISLAHHGVLFLDELSLFRKETLDALRQPMESRFIRIGNGKLAQTLPADCIIIAAMNPCSCGYYGDSVQPCRCSDYQRRLYWQRLSGPLFDRFDMIVRVKSVEIKAQARTSLVYKEQQVLLLDKVYQSQQRQHTRYNSSNSYNGNVCGNKPPFELEHDSESLLRQVVQTHGLSQRVATRIARVARTIADLDDSPDVSTTHIAEALQYRDHDIQSFGGTP